jgi:hypothetical protein
MCGEKQERVHNFGPKTLRHHHFEEKVRDIIKMFVKLREYRSTQWHHLARSRPVVSYFEHSNKLSGSVADENFQNQLRQY